MRLTYTIPGACEATGLGETTVRAEIKAGRLRTVRVGRRVLIPVGELEAWLRRQSDGGAR